MDVLKSWVVALAVTSLFLVGCESGAPDGSEPDDVGTSDDGGATAVSEEDLGDPVATRTVNYDGGKVRLELYPLHGDGAVVTLQAKVTFVTKPGNATGLISGPDESGMSPTGFLLVDTAKAMAYRPARDADDAPVCSPQSIPVYPDAGAQTIVSCTFAGLPKGISKLDVKVSNFGNFPGVPVE